ncbi:hypothetical protein ACFE04_006789 [Oxalis oulophora]
MYRLPSSSSYVTVSLRQLDSANRLRRTSPLSRKSETTRNSDSLPCQERTKSIERFSLLQIVHRKTFSEHPLVQIDIFVPRLHDPITESSSSGLTTKYRS